MISPSLWNDTLTAAIINHLWQSTLMLPVAWLLACVLQHNRAHIRYWIWMAASVKFLVPLSLLAALGERLASKCVVCNRGADIPIVIVGMANPFSQGTTGFPNTDAAVPIAGRLASGPHYNVVLIIGFVIWLMVAACLFVRWSLSWISLYKTVASSTRVSLPLEVPVFTTRRSIEPGVFGIVRQKLLLPEEVIQKLPPAQLQSILAHEMCHVRRRDNLTAAVHMVVQLLFWFHPAVWWIEHRLIDERERACDEAVLQLGTDAETYAESILSVCKLFVESPLACMSGVTGSELKQRILRIMTKQVLLDLDFGRKLVLGTISVATVSMPVLFGLLHIRQATSQSQIESRNDRIVATWQGILHTDRDYRFVIKITREGGEAIRGVFYNIDGPIGGIPIASPQLNGSNVNLDLGFATYQGTLSADSNSIDGRWTQGSNSTPLTLSRAASGAEWKIPQPPPRLPAMAADANPTFEVATIKPSRPDERGPRYAFDQRRFAVVHVNLNQLVQFSYHLHQLQIANAPEWFDSESYDITAEPDGEGEPSIKQWQSMVRKLMADRFQLKSHVEQRELTVYALTVSKNGPKLTKSHSDPNAPVSLGFGPPGNMGAMNATMADLAEAIQQGATNRPVVDQTGIMGRFDLRLKWTPDDIPATADGVDVAPSLFTAIQDQWGLKLLPTKAKVSVLVIDSVTRPSPN